jgi:hypothetical protein
MGYTQPDDLFDLGELELGSGGYGDISSETSMNNGNGGQRNGWQLPTEAFELRQEIVPSGVLAHVPFYPDVAGDMRNMMRLHQLHEGYDLMRLNKLQRSE